MEFIVGEKKFTNYEEAKAYEAELTKKKDAEKARIEKLNAERKARIKEAESAYDVMVSTARNFDKLFTKLYEDYGISDIIDGKIVDVADKTVDENKSNNTTNDFEDIFCDEFLNILSKFI